MNYITIECGVYECCKPVIYAHKKEALHAAIKRAEGIAAAWGCNPVDVISNIDGDGPGERRIYVNDGARSACIEVFEINLNG